jgi:hypothetical protein
MSVAEKQQMDNIWSKHPHAFALVVIILGLVFLVIPVLYTVP